MKAGGEAPRPTQPHFPRFRAGWREGGSVRLLTRQQHIIIIRDERYHSPCRVGTWVRRAFTASAKHNGVYEWLPVEAATFGSTLRELEGKQ